MTIMKIKEFTARQETNCNYFIGRDKETSKLYLFRELQNGEEKWYLNEENENFNKELMAVRLHEVTDIEEGKKDIKDLWNISKTIHERKEII